MCSSSYGSPYIVSCQCAHTHTHEIATEILCVYIDKAYRHCAQKSTAVVARCFSHKGLTIEERGLFAYYTILDHVAVLQDLSLRRLLFQRLKLHGSLLLHSKFKTFSLSFFHGKASTDLGVLERALKSKPDLGSLLRLGA